MGHALAFIGFGEAGQAFAPAGRRGYDRKTDDAKRADFARAGVVSCASAAEALAGADGVLSLVTADQALLVAEAHAAALPPGAFWFDMNSVAPTTKRAAAAAVEAAGGRYVDVAVMSPVHPKRLATPLLASGPHAEDAAEMLRGAGFSEVRVVDGPVGTASSIKMLRSVVVKGMEALVAECVLAAERAGVADEVLGSLGASFPGIDWASRADYCLDRMMIHGLRRAAEMEEVVKTLDALGIDPAMTRGTVLWERAIGEMGIDPQQGLGAKIAALQPVIPAKAGISSHEETPAFAGVTRNIA